MKYYVHEKHGHVSSLDDDESADNLPGGQQGWARVYLRAKPEPSMPVKIFASIFAIGLSSMILATAVGAVLLLWKAVL